MLIMHFGFEQSKCSPAIHLLINIFQIIDLTLIFYCSVWRMLLSVGVITRYGYITHLTKLERQSSVN